MWPWGGIWNICVQILTYTIRFFISASFISQLVKLVRLICRLFQKISQPKNGQPKIPASISEPGELGYWGLFFFFSLPLAPANGQEHRWSLSTVTVTSPSFSEDLFGVENWVEDSGSLTLSLVFLLSFLFVHAFELNKESLNKCEGILRRKGFEMFWYFWLISLIAGFSSIWGWFQSSSGRILTAFWSRHVFQCFFQDETSAFFPGKPNYALFLMATTLLNFRGFQLPQKK